MVVHDFRRGLGNKECLIPKMEGKIILNSLYSALIQETDCF